MSLKDLSNRSRIPTPTAYYGSANHPIAVEVPIYDGTLLPRFLQKKGLNPYEYRKVLRLNRIGNVFKELEPGQAIALPKASSILKHEKA